MLSAGFCQLQGQLNRRPYMFCSPFQNFLTDSPAESPKKKVRESKQAVIRMIFIRLINFLNQPSEILAAQNVIRIRKYIYSSDTLSAFEMGNGFLHDPLDAICIPSRATYLMLISRSLQSV